jgi:aspartate racemase
MKTVGLIGGTGQESTIEYYRLIIDGYSKQSADGSYPSIVIHSVNLPKLLALMNAGKLDQFAEEFANAIALLDRAGVDFGALTANTPHIVFDELRRRSRIPLISIVETTCDRAQELGLKIVGLLGTGFTMQASFYPEVFSRAGISVIVPDEEQASLHSRKVYWRATQGCVSAANAGSPACHRRSIEDNSQH